MPPCLVVGPGVGYVAALRFPMQRLESFDRKLSELSGEMLHVRVALPLCSCVDWLWCLVTPMTAVLYWPIPLVS